MKKIGFLGLGVMGLSMALNVSKKIGVEVIGYDVSETQLHRYREMGGTVAASAEELYSTCDVLLQMLPTHAIIQHSVEEAIRLGRPGNIIVDLSSAAPDIILDLNKKAMNAGMFLLDSPVSGGNPMAEAGTLSIMTGGDPQAFEKVKPVLECMGTPVYTGGSGSGDTTKLINNMVGGAILVAIAEGYAFAAKAGIDLQTTFEATRHGFARIAVHRKDILNAIHYAHKMDVDLPLTDVVLRIMDWANDNGYVNEDQAALVRYYEDKMQVTVGQEEK